MRGWLFYWVVVWLFHGTLVQAQEVLVEDELAQRTTGRQDGQGEFVEGGGWRSQGGFIVYDAGRVLENGYFEATMRGWTPPGEGIDKSHPLSGWEIEDQFTHYAQMGSFWNWRIGTGYFPFKVLAAPRTIESRVEARVGDVNALPNADPHRYRVEWRGGTVRFLFDGQLMQEWAFDRFAMRYFLVGKDEQYGITNPAPIISDVVVVDRAVQPEPEPDPMPEPEPEGEAFVLTTSPTQDTFTDPRNAASVHGELDNLQVGGNGLGEEGRTTYLQFDLGQVDGVIEEATLRLTATNGGGAGRVRTVAENAWLESELTWEQRPAVGDTVFANWDGVMAGTSYEWPLSGPFPPAGGAWSLALTSTEDDGAAFASKENGAATNRPQLVLKVRPAVVGVDAGRIPTPVVDAGQPHLDSSPPTGDAVIDGGDLEDDTDVTADTEALDGEAQRPMADRGGAFDGEPTMGGCMNTTGRMADGIAFLLLACLLICAMRPRIGV